MKRDYEEKDGLVELCDKVYSFIGRANESNKGFLLSQDGIILVDNHVKFYEPLMQAIRRVSNRPIQLVFNTHNDYDHFSANHLFRKQGSTVISSAWCQNRIAQMMSQEAAIEEVRIRNLHLAQEIMNPKDLIPHWGIEGKAVLKWGGETVELTCVGHGHTLGDMMVYLPDPKVLFSGDLVFSGVHGRLKNANIENLLTILDRLSSLPIDHLVPGHGFPVKGPAVRETITTYRDYLVTARERIGDMIKAGASLEKIKAGFQDWKYWNWDCQPFFDTAIENIYKEVQWRNRFEALSLSHSAS